jgi:hypothetical protein
MQEEIDTLMIVNEAFGNESDRQKKIIEEFGNESDRQKKMIEDLENRLKSVAVSVESEAESESESESESEIGSESYVESEEAAKKGRRVQPKRKAKKAADDMEAEDARVFIYFIYILLNYL